METADGVMTKLFERNSTIKVEPTVRRTGKMSSREQDLVVSDVTGHGH